MSTRSVAWPAGVPCWADLATSDVEGARALYGEVFGWETTDPDEAYGGYVTCTLGRRTAAGIVAAQEDQRPAWMVYIASDDVEATAAAITANGGTVLFGPHAAGELGRFVVALDPQGTAFGVWQAGEHIGAGVVNEPGGLVWEEATVGDPEAARDFYGEVFGWQYKAIGDAGQDYTMFALADEVPLGGISGAVPEGHPPYWLAYFGVADTDAAIAAAERHGGKLLRPAWDSPYGRMAVLADASKAVFAVIQTTGEGMPDRSS